MKCPTCNLDLEKGICIKCGYMENGNKIERFKNTHEPIKIRLYNENYDEMNSNQKNIINLIMGSYYFSYRGHIITGLLITTLSTIILKFIIKITNSLALLGIGTLILRFLIITIYLIISRILYMSFSNAICIGLDKIRIKNIKNNEKLIKHKSKNIPLLVIHIILGIILLIVI